MNTNAGLWIDHREAVIALVSDKAVETKKIASHVEKQLRRSNGVCSTRHNESKPIRADGSVERDFAGNLQRYYDQIIDSISNAESVVIYGPGEAKVELKKRIEQHSPYKHMLTVVAADKMSDRQFVAKIRKHFHPKT